VRAAGRQLGHEPLEAIGASRRQNERRACAGELARQRLADTRRAAGDQDNLILKRDQGDARVMASSA